MADLRERLQDGLADRYRLERELGRGGMATVYFAYDLRHDRPVALKVLQPELAATLGPERFQREIKLAARLQHPHILTVHDSGEAAGQLWFTMPYVEGESLRDRLRRDRQLPVDDALRIATDAARALEYAHQHGVVHRDIKPENLLLTKDGSTLVADFGIARALSGVDDQLTQTGMSVGTPAYMSPEQASGERALDARTDVYSLGAVLYEMLAGEPPYTGPSAQAIIVKRLTDPVPSVRRARPSVPDSVDQAVQRALAPVPADRFATAAQFAQALQPTVSTPWATPAVALTAGPGPAPAAPTVPVQQPLSPKSARRRVPVAAVTLGLGLLIGLGVLFAWRHAGGGGAPGSGTKVLAVLPFENLGDSADAYFADGVTDEVRTKLAQVSGLEVIARGSSIEYRRTAKRPTEIAHELGADYLLTGTVRWEKAAGASRVRVTPELVDARPGQAARTRWGQQFDAALTDVFQVQADIATKVADALGVALADSARHELTAKPTENLAAYDEFLKGEAASQAMAAVDPGSMRRAIGFYERAVALDSIFMPAWAQLGRARASLYSNSIPLPELGDQAKLAAERALALGPKHPEGYNALGDFYSSVNPVDNSRALAAYESGLKLAPNSVELLGAAALTQVSLGQWEAGLPRLERAAALDPRSANAARRLALVFLYLRRYAAADSAADRALILGPTNLRNIEQKVMVALARGDLEGARAVIRAASPRFDQTALLPYLATYQDLYWVLDDDQRRQVLALPLSAFDGDAGNRGIVLTQIYHLLGDRSHVAVYADSARLAFEEQSRATPDDGQRHVFLGLALAYLGRKAAAIKEGERAVALTPITRDAYLGAYMQHQLVRIYLLIGEPDKALDRLEPLLRMPYYLSPGWLRVDPTFDPLRNNPRFQKLVEGAH